MNEELKHFECGSCHKINIVVTEEAEDTKKRGKYLACIHCGSKDLIKMDPFKGINECMKERKYKRNGHGAIEQVK